MVHRAHQVDELLINDADDLLARIECFEHLLAYGLLGYALHEIPHDRESYVGLEQRFFDELESVAHVRFGELALAAKRLQCGIQAVLEGFKHNGREQGAGYKTASLRLAGVSSILTGKSEPGRVGPRCVTSKPTMWTLPRFWTIIATEVSIHDALPL